MDYDAIVVGSGFGGTAAATTLVRARRRVLILERGTWWLSPEELGSPPPLAPGRSRLPDWLKAREQPVQYWPRPNHKDGLLYLFAANRTKRNPDGLYKITSFDEATVVTASAVGGGSMVYSNVNLRADPEVLETIGLPLGAAEYDAARTWMEDVRGPLNRIVTKVPLPGRDVSDLGDDEYLYFDRSRVFKHAAADVAAKLGIELPGRRSTSPSWSSTPTGARQAAQRETTPSASGRGDASSAVCPAPGRPSTGACSTMLCRGLTWMRRFYRWPRRRGFGASTAATRSRSATIATAARTGRSRRRASSLRREPSARWSSFFARRRRETWRSGTRRVGGPA